MIRTLTSTTIALALAVSSLAAQIPDQDTRQAEIREPFDEADLNRLVAGVERVIPVSWHVLESGINRSPVGWSGPENGLYVLIEDTQTRFFHPAGFHYYSFYRIWIMPPDWEGEMQRTPYVADSSPAFLLGLNDDYVALYHTAGGNVWEEGPSELCNVLGLDAIRYSDLTRRVVDMAMEERLVCDVDATGGPAAAADSLFAGGEHAESDLFEMNPYRIVGLAGEGVGLYLEYVFPGEEDREVTLAALTERLAGDVFARFPEVESLYLRRCTTDTFTDTIVNRD
jgi:hypothetical protein